MKTALLISGQVRDGTRYLKAVKRFAIDGVDPDVFIHSYECEQQGEIESFYRPKGAVWEDPEQGHGVDSDTVGRYESRKDRATTTSVENCLKQWRKRRLAFDMLPSRYDRVAVTRFDCYGVCQLCNHLHLEDIVVPQHYGWGYGVCDLFASGPWEKMRYYCRLGEMIPVYIEGGIKFHPETLLRFHLDMRLDEHAPPIWTGVPLGMFLRGRAFSDPPPIQ